MRIFIVIFSLQDKSEGAKNGRKSSIVKLHGGVIEPQNIEQEMLFKCSSPATNCPQYPVPQPE
jgi:hypothetical protein